jgi:hypothetical protein
MRNAALDMILNSFVSSCRRSGRVRFLPQRPPVGGGGLLPGTRLPADRTDRRP